MNKMGTKLEFLKPFEKGLAKKMKKRGLTITVSGLSKSGKSTIAKSIAKAFKLRYIFAGEIQRQLAKENGISLERQVRTRKAEVDYEIDRKSLEFAMRGGVVIDARLSGWVAGDWADAKIFVKCSLEDRARRLAEDEGITIKEARELIRKRDEGDSEKYRQLYKIDQTDISIYDIVIDNSRLALNEARTVPVKLVKEFLKKKSL
jgi:cytidylate kinase